MASRSRAKNHIQEAKPAQDIGKEDNASSLLLRTQLMKRLGQLISETGLSQSAVAKLLGVKQPRIAEIMGMKIEYFSVDTLLKYLDKMGDQITIVSKRIGSPSQALTLVQSWLDDESNYDATTWPVIKENSEASRLSARKLFRE
jgi:predicted XRE-type DNA-binding protein